MAEMADPQALERGISNLDKIMAHFRQKIEDCERRIELDTEDLKWVEREIAHSEPKLKALEDEHAKKLKERELLAEEVRSFHSLLSRQSVPIRLLTLRLLFLRDSATVQDREQCGEDSGHDEKQHQPREVRQEEGQRPAEG